MAGDAHQRIKRDENMFKRLQFIQELLAIRAARENRRHTGTNEDRLLDKVLDEIQQMDRRKHPKNDSTCDCIMDGAWVSESAGGIFVLPKHAAGGCTKDGVCIVHKRAHDRQHVGFMNIKDWNSTLRFPFSSTNQYIVVTSINVREKLIATFMGECRMCRKHPVLQGNWLVLSHSRDCESLGSTAKLISDVWRRDNCESLRIEHVCMIQSRKKPKAMSKPLPKHCSQQLKNVPPTPSPTAICPSSTTPQIHFEECSTIDRHHTLHFKLH